MDDDGLVLNLADNITLASNPKNGVKGGRWTDRVKAKRVAKRKARPGDVVKPGGKNQNHHEVQEEEGPRPTKKPRRDDTSGKSTSSMPPARQATHSSHPSQVISSLFTSNPEVKETHTYSVAQRSSKPSNAPLTDRSTFTGLGLDPLIVSHLSTKMNITTPTSIQREALPPLLSTLSENTSDRDVFISSQTGSGKTLSFLLPIIQDLLPLSSLSYIDRSIGTLAIIIAPTRELAKQISDVLENLLTLRLRPQDEASDDPNPSSTRLTRWLVSGLLTGGATRTHEKARIRKGLPILVSTPGRLLDHLQNTSSFNVGKCRWLVLDEADRLMELGFEESIQGILKALEGRRKLAIQAMEEGKSAEVAGWDWERRRRTVLCSATIREDVQQLAGTALIKPIVVKAVGKEASMESGDGITKPLSGDIREEKFTPPSQLSQKYTIVPLKLRLVTLIALLRTLLAQSQNRQGTKIIIFLSCTDSVDFHWHLLGSSSIDENPNTSESAESRLAEKGEDSDSDSSAEDDGVSPPKEEPISLKSALLPETSIFRLHGSLPQATRIASLKGFSNPPKVKPTSPSSAILLCTSVASRGLDLPLVRAVVQYDLPTEGGATEYVHRVGRTARVGKGGEAWSFVAPSEEEWVKWIEEKIQDDNAEGKKVVLSGVGVDTILQSGLGGKGKEFETRATEVQLSFERWVLKQKTSASLARKAFQSHMRAYATHPSNEKHMFHIRHLHIGHLAKAFALRDAPSATGGGSKQKPSLKPKSNGKRVMGVSKSGEKPTTTGKGRHRDWIEEQDGVAEKRMREVVRAQGRLTKKGGMLVTSGISEFQITGGDALEKLATRR